MFVHIFRIVNEIEVIPNEGEFIGSYSAPFHIRRALLISTVFFLHSSKTQKEMWRTVTL